MFVFVTIRQSIDMGVMDERVVAISPGELLGPDAEVVVGDELWRVVLRSVGENEGRGMTQDDDGAGHEEEDLLPHLPAIVSVGSRHLPHLAHVHALVLSQSQQSAGEGSHPCLYSLKIFSNNPSEY